MEKIITPEYSTGKRRKLLGFIGELRDGETVISSKEYSTYHAAEVALDALAFDIMIDAQMDAADQSEEDDSNDLIEAMADDDYAEAMAEQAMGTYNGFVPSTCCFCHKPHHPADCPEMRAMLFAPDTSNAADPLDFDEAALDAYYTKRDAISELVMSAPDAPEPTRCVTCGGDGDCPDCGVCGTCKGEKRIPAYGYGDQAGGYAETCPDCNGKGISTPRCATCGGIATHHVSFENEPCVAYYCDTHIAGTYYISTDLRTQERTGPHAADSDPIYPPLDVEFAPIGFEV